jgi:hypothetical protein
MGQALCPSEFAVAIHYDPDAALWCAACPEIGVFTEAASVDAVIASCWELAPWLAPDYGVDLAAGLRLIFSVEDAPRFAPFPASADATHI